MKSIRSLLKLTAGTLAGYTTGVFSWLLWQLLKSDPRTTLLKPQNTALQGRTCQQEKEHPGYLVRHIVEDGIEWVSYYPKERRFETPLLMQHGMFHAAWCWADWQAIFAQWGWESHAISLPGHGGSPLQRPIRKCTLDYYLAFLRDAVEKLETPPVLLGHSMGGALTQWYLKYGKRPPRAAVFVASWVADSALRDGFWLLLRQDPAILPAMLLDWDTSSWIRTPQRAAEKFISPGARLSAEELHACLGPESALVLFQHNPPFWSPPRGTLPPSFWLAGEADTVVSVAGLRRSAHIFGGDFVSIPGAAHNLMMEANAPQTAERIHEWLLSQRID